MDKLNYLNIQQAVEALSKIGLQLNDRQMKRAAETDIHGQRKLPFFIDPIDKKLKIEKSTLLNIYIDHQKTAENSAFYPKLD